MSRTRNKRLGLLDGSRKAVVSAERPRPEHPRQWRVTLSCGHAFIFGANAAPKHLRCPRCLPGAAVVETEASRATRRAALDRLSPRRHPEEMSDELAAPADDCRPDCPGGMCARRCHETESERAERGYQALLAEARQHDGWWPVPAEEDVP